jgi:hypothetical protein
MQGKSGKATKRQWPQWQTRQEPKGENAYITQPWNAQHQINSAFSQEWRKPRKPD